MGFLAKKGVLRVVQKTSKKLGKTQKRGKKQVNFSDFYVFLTKNRQFSGKYHREKLGNLKKA